MTGVECMAHSKVINYRNLHRLPCTIFLSFKGVIESADRGYQLLNFGPKTPSNFLKFRHFPWNAFNSNTLPMNYIHYSADSSNIFETSPTQSQKSRRYMYQFVAVDGFYTNGTYWYDWNDIDFWFICFYISNVWDVLVADAISQAISSPQSKKPLNVSFPGQFTFSSWRITTRCRYRKLDASSVNRKLRIAVKKIV